MCEGKPALVSSDSVFVKLHQNQTNTETAMLSRYVKLGAQSGHMGVSESVAFTIILAVHTDWMCETNNDWAYGLASVCE